MPSHCCITGCGSRWGQKSPDDFLFYRVPKTTDNRGKKSQIKLRRRQAWLDAIGRADISNLKNPRVCSKHFVTGASNAEDWCETHPDWAPSKFLVPDNNDVLSPTVAKRNNRQKKTPQNVQPENFTQKSIKFKEENIAFKDNVEHEFYQQFQFMKCESVVNNVDEYIIAANNFLEEHSYIKKDIIESEVCVDEAFLKRDSILYKVLSSKSKKQDAQKIVLEYNSTSKKDFIVPVICEPILDNLVESSADKNNYNTNRSIEDYEFTPCDKINVDLNDESTNCIKEFSCFVCNQVFTNQVLLKNHMNVHEEFKCLVCNNMFSDKYDLERLLDIYKGIKNFECSFCNKKYRRTDALNMHIKVQAPGKEFKCLMCNKQFLKKAYLERHKKTHKKL